MKTARFWTFVNDGFVKLSIRPGQVLTWGWSARHDEGWSSEVTVWTHSGESVTRETFADGRDCDGRTSDDQTVTCPLTDLATWDTTIEGAPMVPTWIEVRNSRYDQFAEASGY